MINFGSTFDTAVEICRMVKEAGGRAYVAGGAARDIWQNRMSLIPIDVKDIDLEVFGIKSDALVDLLGSKWKLDVVGKAFGVIKLHGFAIDVCLPRRERQEGQGHKDFSIEADPDMTLLEAASRRDFTINAVSWDPLEDRWEDPFMGREDMQNLTLRPVSERFSEDPLRVLRGMQFIARFGLSPSAECVQVCSRLSQEHLPRERIWEEWKKLILRGIHIRKAMDFLLVTGWMERFYPELFALVDSLQHPAWHPEGDVYTHTCLVVEAFTRGVFKDEEEKLVLGLAAFCHDLGKPATAVFGPTKNNPEPHWTNRGHENYIEPTERFLARLTNEATIVYQVIRIVKSHMKPMSFARDKADLSAFRRLSLVANISQLAKMSRFDQGGRGSTKPPDEEALAWFIAQAEAAKVLYAKPVPLIFGRDLLAAFGLKPGKELGGLLAQLMEKQLAGDFFTKEEGLVLAKTLVSNISSINENKP